MADLETLQTRLAEAQAARHALATGQRVVEVVRDGKRMRFQESNKGDLAGYIDELGAAIAELQQPVIGALPRRRFIPVAF